MIREDEIGCVGNGVMAGVVKDAKFDVVEAE